MNKFTYKNFYFLKIVLLFLVFFFNSQVKAQQCGAIVTLYQTVIPVPAIAGVTTNILKYNRFTNTFVKVASLPIGVPTNSAYNTGSKYIYLAKSSTVGNVYVVYDPANNFQYVGELTVNGVTASVNNSLFSEGNTVGYVNSNKIVTFDVVNISGSYTTNNARTVASEVSVTGGGTTANDYAKINGVIYGMTAATGTLVSFSPSGAMTTRNLTIDNNGLGGAVPGSSWGAAWGDAKGNLYVFNNNGDIYRLDNVSDPSSVTLRKIFLANASG